MPHIVIVCPQPPVSFKKKIWFNVIWYVVTLISCRIVVASDYIGAVIGKQGQTIRKITSESRAR